MKAFMAPSLSSLADLSKWMGLVAAIWVQAFAGNGSAYANYSSTLKSVLSINQVQLNYLALAKDFGENVGIIAGVLCNKVPPWVILSIAAAEGFLGFGVVWLVASGTISPLPLWQMCIAICVGSNSTTFFNTAVLVTCMRNFPNTRGTIVGFLKGFIGLSGAIFTQIYTSLLASDAVRLLLFLALGPTLVCLLSMGFIRPVKPTASPGILHDLEETRQFRFIYIICIALAAYLFVVVFLDQFVANPLVSKIVAVVMLLFLVAPVLVPARVLIEGLLNRSKDREEPFISSVDDANEPMEQSEKPGEGQEPGSNNRRASWKSSEPEEEDTEVLLALGEGAVKRRKRRPRRGEDFNLRQALVKADFWLMFMAFFCGIGTAITASDNLGQLGQAQGYSDVSIFILLSCIWGFLGRLGGGSISEHFIRTYFLPRPVWIAAAQAIMIIAHLLLAFALPGTLYPAMSIVGLSFGIQIAVMVPTASEIFGLKHFGILYNFINLADPVASLLFSTLLAGSLYDIEVEKQYPSSPRSADLVCTGAHCFRLTFLIMAAVCVVGVALCIVLSIRLRPVYVMLYGSQDSLSASYNSLPSANASSSSLPRASSFYSFPAASSSSSSLPPASQMDLH